MAEVKKKRRRRIKLGEGAGLRAFRLMERFLGQRDVARAERRGAWLGGLWFRLDKRRVKLGLGNMRLAFPELTDEERLERLQRTCRHFGIVIADFMRTRFRTNEELLATVEFGGDDDVAYRAAVAPDKGIIATPPHFGNWERFGHWLLATDRMITVVARDANEGSVNEAVNTLRRKNGMGVIARGDSARDILKLLRRKEIVGLLPDQNSNECFVPFFGHPAGTVMGPAVLHIRTGAPLLPCGCIRIGVGRYRVICEPPLFAREGETPEELTARLNVALEALVRRAPDQYLWMHDRWKSARRKGLLPPGDVLVDAPRVLIVRYSAIGDTLMDTWAVSALRRARPDTLIHWIVESRCAPVLDTARMLDRRIEIERKGIDGRKTRGGTLAQLRLCASLRRERYDVGVDFQGHSKTALALRLAGPRRAILARAKDGLARSLAPVAPHSATHHVEIAAEVLGAAIGTTLAVDERPFMPPAPARDPGLATIAVSAGRPERALSPVAITETARGLVARGFRVELLGGPNDRAPEDLGGATDRVGRMSLAETMARIAESGITVAGDTGAGHIAAAYGTPLVSVFGPAPSAWTGPWSSALDLIEGGERTDLVNGATILAACDRLREVASCAF